MSVTERSIITTSPKQRNKLLFRPRRRLRHLQGVEVFRLAANPDSFLYYEIHSVETSEIIKSEKVPYSRHVEWEAIDFAALNLSATTLHGYRSGIFEVIILSSMKKGGCTTQEQDNIVIRIYVDLNEVVFTRKTEDLTGVCLRLKNGLHCVPSTEGVIVSFLHTALLQVGNNDLLLTTDNRSEGSDYSLYHPASSSNDGVDTWLEVNQGAKLYNTMERRVDIRRLSTVQNNFQELIDRRRKLNLYLSKLLEDRRSRIQAIHKLERLRQSTNEKGVQAVNVEFRLAEIMEYWSEQREKKLKTIEFLQAAYSELREAVNRLMESADSLSQQIVSKSGHLHSQLVSRRCQLVSSMASSFGLRPYDVSVLSSDAVEHKIIVDRQWWRTGPSVLLTSPIKSETALRHHQFSSEHNRGHTYLGIVGIDFSPSIVGMIENGFVEGSLTQPQRECIEAALYYVASIVTLCSFYLDVPLRYPIRLMGSRSMISVPSTSRLSLPSSSSSLSSAKDWTPPSQGVQHFPLFFQGSGGVGKRRLAHGFMLLDRNIQQLLATHGVKYTDRSYLLQSLDALVSASRSGIGTIRKDHC